MIQECPPRPPSLCDRGLLCGSEQVTGMRVLVVGSGGREHALCWAIAASPLCDALFCAPGNAGIAEDAVCVPIAASNTEALIAFASGRQGEAPIDLVVVGPEGPLAAGLVDALEAAGIPAFGPTQAAAELESSKGWMKDFCARHGIPTAAYARFDRMEEALAHLRQVGAPVVVKADGLASGKGCDGGRYLGRGRSGPARRHGRRPFRRGGPLRRH